jgi:hypothetical protein
MNPEAGYTLSSLASPTGVDEVAGLLRELLILYRSTQETPMGHAFAHVEVDRNLSPA